MQEIARSQLTPWLQGEQRYAEEVYRKAVRRFVQLGNNFLQRLADMSVPEIDRLPEELGGEQSLGACSEFRFHVIERVAAPASPFLFAADLVRGVLGLRAGMVSDAGDFFEQLLEVNSARVQSDVDQRIAESRKTLESEIRALLREATRIAQLALARARAAQTAGAPAVQAALARLEAVEREALVWASHPT